MFGPNAFLVFTRTKIVQGKKVKITEVFGIELEELSNQFVSI